MIDDRLREILDQFTDKPLPNDKNYRKGQDDIIAQIKQAFHDDGYRWLPKQHDIQSLVDEGLAEFQMTGQEWYDRFEKEAPGSTEPHVLEAARKAAGLTDA